MSPSETTIIITEFFYTFLYIFQFQEEIFSFVFYILIETDFMLCLSRHDRITLGEFICIHYIYLIIQLGAN